MATAARSDNHLSRGFQVEWGGKANDSAWRPDDVPTRNQLAAACDRMRDGKHTLADVRRIAEAVGRLLRSTGVKDLTTLLDMGSLSSDIEIEPVDGDPRLLTDLPWETVAIDGQAATGTCHAFAVNSLAARPIVRVASGPPLRPLDETPGRLRALLCVAQPQGGTPGPDPAAQGPKLDPVNVDEFVDTLHSAFLPYLAIDVRWPEVTADQLSLDVLQATIRQIEPDIFVIVAHGSAGAVVGAAPSVRLADGWHSVSAIAATLAQAGHASLAVWICCDLARTPAGASARSAALACIDAGVAEVVAMQGNIKQVVAEPFLRHFLAQLLVGSSVPRATCVGRIAVAGELHGFLPAAFRCTGWDGTYASVVSAKLNAYRAALTRSRADFATPPPNYVPRQLEVAAIDLLSRRGAARLTGPIEAGKSQLINFAARSLLNADGPPTRPVLRLDCRQLTDPPVTLCDVLDETRMLFDQYRNLLPASSYLPVGGKHRWDLVVEALDRCGVTLIIDHPPPAANPEDATDWSDFLAVANEMKNSLLVVVSTSDWFPAQPIIHELPVTFLTPVETRQYLETNAPALVPQTEVVHAMTGGRPHWLDAFRDLHGVDKGTDLDRIASQVRIQSYAQQLRDVLEIHDLVTLHCLVMLPGPADRDLATRYLVPPAGTAGLAVDFDPEATVERLICLGAVGIMPGTNGKLIWVPHVNREAVAMLKTPPLASSQAIAARFARAVGNQWEKAIGAIYADEGGPAVLRAVQKCFLEFARAHAGDAESAPLTAHAWQAAAGIASYADSDYRITRDLLELYRGLSLEDVPHSIQRTALRRGAMLARALGLADLAADYVARLEGADTSPLGRAEFLLARGRVAKDLRQQAAIADILADVQNGLVALQDSAVGADAERLAIELRQLRIDTRLFLEGAPVSAIGEDATAIEQSNPTFAQRANLHATLAERLRNPRSDELVDWSLLGKTALDGYEAARQTDDPRARGFANYQYARYVELMPKPEYAEAVRCYQEAEKNARAAGEPRREALDGLRRIEIEWRHLRSLDSRAADGEASRLLALLPNLGRADALSLRIAQRLHLFRFTVAKADPMLGSRLESLQAACRFGGRIPAGSPNDDRRLGSSLRQFLAALHAAGSFRDAQLLLREMEKVLRERLSLVSDLLDPWGVEGELAERYNHEK